MKKQKLFVLALTLVMVISMTTVGFAAIAYTDIDGHWAKDAIGKWSDMGIIQGNDGMFKPSNNITRGDMAVILDRVMKYQVEAKNTFTDLKDAYYTSAVLKANQAQILLGSGTTVRPGDMITREEAAVMLGRALGMTESMTKDIKFVDQAEISTWALGYVGAMADAGYIKGFEGKFNPKAYITRAEVVSILDKSIAKIHTDATVVTGTIEGTLVVNAQSTVKDAVVKGNLIIAEGVGNGDVVLENVVVDGDVIVRGGGANSIHIRGNSKVGKVVVEKRDNFTVSIKVTGNAKVETIVAKAGTVNVSGTVAKMEVMTNAITNLINAKVEKLSILGDNAVVTVDKTSTVKEATITGKNAAITGAGKVEKVIVKANGAKINTPGTKVEVAAGVTGTTAGNKPVPGGTTATTPGTSGGGSGNTGGGGGEIITKTYKVVVTLPFEIDGRTDFTMFVKNTDNVLEELDKRVEEAVANLTPEKQADLVKKINENTAKLNNVKVNGKTYTDAELVTEIKALVGLGEGAWTKYITEDNLVIADVTNFVNVYQSTFPTTFDKTTLKASIEARKNVNYTFEYNGKTIESNDVAVTLNAKNMVNKTDKIEIAHYVVDNVLGKNYTVEGFIAQLGDKFEVTVQMGKDAAVKTVGLTITEEK